MATNDGHSLDLHAPLFEFGDAIPAAYATVGLTVTILKNRLHSPPGVSDALDNLLNGPIM
jgi:hypothetical protein